MSNKSYEGSHTPCTTIFFGGGVTKNNMHKFHDVDMDTDASQLHAWESFRDSIDIVYNGDIHDDSDGHGQLLDEHITNVTALNLMVAFGIA